MGIGEKGLGMIRGWGKGGKSHMSRERRTLWGDLELHNVVIHLVQLYVVVLGPLLRRGRTSSRHTE